MKAVADFTRGPVTGPLSRRMNSATVVAEWKSRRLHFSARLIFDHSLPGDKFAFQAVLVDDVEPEAQVAMAADLEAGGYGVAHVRLREEMLGEHSRR